MKVVFFSCDSVKWLGAWWWKSHSAGWYGWKPTSLHLIRTIVRNHTAFTRTHPMVGKVICSSISFFLGGSFWPVDNSAMVVCIVYECLVSPNDKIAFSPSALCVCLLFFLLFFFLSSHSIEIPSAIIIKRIRFECTAYQLNRRFVFLCCCKPLAFLHWAFRKIYYRNEGIRATSTKY